jgi:hypothetical protein
MGWDRLDGDEVPNWIREVIDKMPKGHAADTPELEKVVHGDTFVYKIVMNEDNVTYKTAVYKQLKSNYFTTTTKEGTCPNCQSYIKRYEDDDYLTCHRCGWQYKPFGERLKNIF